MRDWEDIKGTLNKKKKTLEDGMGTVWPQIKNKLDEEKNKAKKLE